MWWPICRTCLSSSIPKSLALTSSITGGTSEVATERQHPLCDVIAQLHDSLTMRCLLSQLLLSPTEEESEVHRIVALTGKPRLGGEELLGFLGSQSISPGYARHDANVALSHYWQRACGKIVAMSAPLRNQTLLNAAPRSINILARQPLSGFFCLAVSNISSTLPPLLRTSGRRAAAKCRHHPPFGKATCTISSSPRSRAMPCTMHRPIFANSTLAILNASSPSACTVEHTPSFLTIAPRNLRTRALLHVGS